MMSMRMACAGALALIVVGGAMATAHELGPIPNTPGGKAAAARHENFKQLGGAFKAISDELKKDSPDKAVLSTNAQKAKTLAAALPTWFPKGSGPETGLKVQAKPDVWKDWAGFTTAAKRLQGETTTLAQVAAGGDVGAVKKQFGATGQACKSCHEKYRLPEKH